MITIESATRTQVATIQLRAVDAQEVSQNWREVVYAHLDETFSAVQPDGTVVALFGFVTGRHELGVWLLCSDAIEQHKATAWRHAKRLVSALRQESRLVFNYIPKLSAGNRLFIERLGFRILPTPNDGPDFFYLPKHV